MKKMFLLFFMTLGMNASADPGGSPSDVKPTTASSLSEKLLILNKRLANSVPMNLVWEDNLEVKEIQTYPILKRMAAVQSLIEIMENNEKKLFPNFDQNQQQYAIGLTSRYVSLQYINELVGETDDEVGMKGYLGAELSDLQLVLSNKIPYEFYLKSRKDRKTKIMYLYGGNPDFIKEAVSLIKASSIINLSNKTSALSLLETCIENSELCENM